MTCDEKSSPEWKALCRVGSLWQTAAALNLKSR